MRRILQILMVLAILPLIIFQKPANKFDSDHVPGELMVQLYDHTLSQQQMINALKQEFSHAGLDAVRQLSSRLNIWLLSFDAGSVAENRLLEDVKEHEYVKLAQFNHYVELRESIPADEYFDLQWNMHNTGQTGGVEDADIDGPEAWDIATGGITATGDTIIIAIVDDGFDLDHEDLDFWKNWREIPNNGIDDDSNGYVDDYDGWNSWSVSGNIIERDHGTHVTGIAAAEGNNDRGVTGVNWNTKVMPIVGSATVESIVVAAYGYVYEMRKRYNESDGQDGAFIVSTNSSFGVNYGQPEDFPIWGAMYDSLGYVGILSAGATANANWDIDEVGDIPTALPSPFLITVTNTTQDDEKATYAGYGDTTIDLGSPGTQIYSTKQNNAYGTKSGTSMATPHVAGAIALMYSAATEDFMNEYHADPGSMALRIKQYIFDGTDPLPTLDSITVTGGRLNLYNSIMLMLEPPLTTDPLSVTATIAPGDEITLPLTIINNMEEPVAYNIVIPDTVTWLSVVPDEGIINSLSNSVVNVTMNSVSMDTSLYYFAEMEIHYGSDEIYIVPVHMALDPFVGTGEVLMSHRILSVYPNPFSDQATIEFSVDKASMVSLKIFDGSGRIVKDIFSGTLPVGSHKIKTGNLPSGGVFYLVIESEGKITSKSLIVTGN